MKVLNFNFSPKHLFTAKVSDYLRSLKFLFLCYGIGQTVTSVCVIPGQLCKHLFLSALFTERREVKVSLESKSLLLQCGVMCLKPLIFSVYIGHNLAG